MLLKLFVTFFKIGLFTIGGGYAMLPVIQKEVVENKNWLTNEDFLDAIAVTNSLPGPIATNTASFVGYRVNGFKGALTAIAGAATPSLIIILIIAMIFSKISDNPIVAYIFQGIRPAVVALILFAIVKLVKSVGVNFINTSIATVAFALIVGFSLHPSFLIIISGLFGFFFLRKEDYYK